MKTTSNLLLLVSSLALGCASTQGVAQRGDLIVHGPSVKAIVVGPTAIRAYSGFVGGSVYTVPAISGTDGDCQSESARSAAHQILQAEQILPLEVGAGQLACLTTTTPGSFELLWRARRGASEQIPTPVTIASAQYTAR